MMTEKNIFTFRNRNQWRSWLDEHHTVASEAWIVIQKKNSPDEGVFLNEAVEEALCYGWIDSTLNTRDDHSYLLRFSPRKPNSVWSINNIRRVEKLQEQGLMMKAGQAAVKAGKKSGEWQAGIDRENPDYIPPDLEQTLKKDPTVWQSYHGLPISKKKRYIYWLQSAKREKTRQKRLSEILRLVSDEG